MKVTDASLRTLVGYRLQRVTSAAMVPHKRLFAKYGLRRTTFSCLALIVDHPGLRQGQLGEVLAIERPNLVNIVEDLTKAGLIQRETSQTDRRAYALSPTEKGVALMKDARTAVDALDQDITEGMTKREVAALFTALEKIERNASK